MFVKSARFYDLIYQSKNYDDECEKIVSLVKSLHPDGKTILDVGCGTGEHARILSTDYNYMVDGIDIEKEFITIAKQKNPNGSFMQADMSDFQLNRHYDIILCLFSAIGYVKTIDKLVITLQRFRDHLSDDGIMLIEPWFTPEQWSVGNVTTVHVEDEDMQICRMSYSDQRENISIVKFKFLVGTKEGLVNFDETHELVLCTVKEMKDSFRHAKLDVEYKSTGLFGKGLYIARKN